MKTIVIAVDFDQVSENAAQYGAQLALDIHADIVLFHTYHYPTMLTDVPLPPQMYTDIMDSARTCIDKLAQKLSVQLNGRRTVHTELREGSFANELLDYCNTHKPYAVVLGSGAITAAGRFFIGSQALAAIKRVPLPLFIIPPMAKYEGIHVAGLASDLVQVEETLPVSAITEMVRSFHAKLVIGHVTSQYPYGTLQRAQAAAAEKLFTENSAEVHYILEENFEEGIDRFCKRFDIDLLVMVPHRHPFFEALLHTSHTARVLSGPFLPMLFLKKQ